MVDAKPTTRSVAGYAATWREITGKAEKPNMTPKKMDPCYKATLADVLDTVRLRPVTRATTGLTWIIATPSGSVMRLPECVVHPELYTDPSIEVALEFTDYMDALMMLEGLRAAYPIKSAVKFDNE